MKYILLLTIAAIMLASGSCNKEDSYIIGQDSTMVANQTGQLTTVGKYAIRNYWKNTDLNIQNNNIFCSAVSSSGTGAQWVLEKIVNTNYVLIKNVSANAYISTQNGNLLSTNGQSGYSEWILENVSSNTYRIKNANNQTYLNIENGSVASTAIQSGWTSAIWILDVIAGSASTGQALFWTQSDLGCGNIAVTLNGNSETISGYFSSGVPNCGASGGATFSAAPGTYNYSASCSGKTWSGSVSITSGSCTATQLVAGSTSGGSTGQLMFWVQSDLGCGTITVSLNSSQGTISQYYSSGAPSCGATGTATFSVAPGSYNFSASCSGKSWSGTVTASAGGCFKEQLTN